MFMKDKATAQLRFRLIDGQRILEQQWEVYEKYREPMTGEWSYEVKYEWRPVPLAD